MMQPFYLPMRLFIFLMLALCGLSGCMTISPMATRFYTLTPLDAGAGLVKDNDLKGPLSVEVSALRLPQYLERPQIVTRSGENMLELAEFHQWGGNLRKDMTLVLAKNLSRLLATPHINIAPFRPPQPPDFRVDLEVMQFERVSDGRVKLSAQWRLSRGKGQESLETRITELTSPKVEPGTDFGPTVSCMSMLLGELSQIISKAILKNAQGAATGRAVS